MIKKTFKELREINGAYMEVFRLHPVVERTKFGYAWNRFLTKNIDHVFREYNTELSMIRIENALTDKVTGEVIFDKTNERGFKYDKEGLKKVITEENKLEAEWDIKTYEVDPYICAYKDIPEFLTDRQKEMFESVVIKGKEDKNESTGNKKSSE